MESADLNKLLANHIICSRSFNKRLKTKHSIEESNLPLTILLLLGARKKALKSEIIQLLASNYYVIDRCISALLISGLTQKSIEPRYIPSLNVTQTAYSYSLTIRGEYEVKQYLGELRDIMGSF